MKRTFLIFICIVFAASAVAAQSAVVVSDNAKLSGTPSLNGRTVETLPKGTVVDVVRQFGDWALVQSENYAGWLTSGSIKITSPLYLLNQTGGQSPAGASSNPQTGSESPAAVNRNPAKQEKPKPDGIRYMRGSRGGCFYTSPTGKKIYVDRSLCS